MINDQNLLLSICQVLSYI